MRLIKIEDSECGSELELSTSLGDAADSLLLFVWDDPHDAEASITLTPEQAATLGRHLSAWSKRRALSMFAEEDLSRCTCDALGDGPCPVHSEAMAEQDARINARNEEQDALARAEHEQDARQAPLLALLSHNALACAE